MKVPSERREVAILYSGLGNRMRVLLSHREAARGRGTAFAYVWRIDHRFQARLRSLWVPPRGQVSLLSVLVERLVAPAKSIIIRTQQPAEALSGRPGWQDRLRELEPSARVTRRVNEISAQLDVGSGTWVGVMIRANAQAHPLTLDASPIAWYLDRMDALLESNSDTQFYVCCDDPRTQEFILQRYPSAHAQLNKGRYNSDRGVVSAVADLFLISRCARVLGPHWSSFLDMAEALAPAGAIFETSQQVWERSAVHPETLSWGGLPG